MRPCTKREERNPEGLQTMLDPPYCSPWTARRPAATKIASDVSPSSLDRLRSQRFKNIPARAGPSTPGGRVVCISNHHMVPWLALLDLGSTGSREDSFRFKATLPLTLENACLNQYVLFKKLVWSCGTVVQRSSVRSIQNKPERYWNAMVVSYTVPLSSVPWL